LLRLHLAELRERAPRGLIAPDALVDAAHRVAAGALLALAASLIAVQDDLVAGLAVAHARADRPDDAARIGAGDVEILLVHVEDRAAAVPSAAHTPL
jgi:hypothetical protein